jgi:glutamate/aspartate transport system substrate-binding protein
MKKQFVTLAVATLLAGTAFAQANDTLAKVKAAGSITMGVRDSSGALSYTLGDGKYVGYHVEICQRIIANIEKAVRIAVRANSGITSIAQLNGKNVATTTGTTSVQLLRKNERATGVDFKEVFGKDHADSFLLLESGRADAFVMDGQILAGNIANSKAPADFKIVGEVLNVEPIAIMFRKDDPAFKKLADETIAGLAKSGELAKLYDKWFTQAIPPKNIKLGMPASDANKDAWKNLNDKPVEAYAKK